MRYVLRHKRNRRRVLENYQRELTTVEVDGDLYYAYINDQNQVEAGCVEHPSWHMILAEGKARFSLRQTLSGGGERRAFSPL